MGRSWKKEEIEAVHQLCAQFEKNRPSSTEIRTYVEKAKNDVPSRTLGGIGMFIVKNYPAARRLGSAMKRAGRVSSTTSRSSDDDTCQQLRDEVGAQFQAGKISVERYIEALRQIDNL